MIRTCRGTSRRRMPTSPALLHTSHTLPILIYIFSAPKCILCCVVVLCGGLSSSLCILSKGGSAVRLARWQYHYMVFPLQTRNVQASPLIWVQQGGSMHRNSDSVVICVPITTHKLCCDIYFLCCNRVTLMQPFLGFVLQLVGNSATPFRSCISMSCVGIERCYGDYTSIGCF